jgi:hypothetical protein
MAVELGTNLGIGNKTFTEIWKETEKLVTIALHSAIRRYAPKYEVRLSDTPETLYVQLWEECCNYKSADTDTTDDVKGKAKVRLYMAIEDVMDYLDSEYNRRQNAFADMGNESEEV